MHHIDFPIIFCWKLMLWLWGLRFVFSFHFLLDKLSCEIKSSTKLLISSGFSHASFLLGYTILSMLPKRCARTFFFLLFLLSHWYNIEVASTFLTFNYGFHFLHITTCRKHWRLMMVPVKGSIPLVLDKIACHSVPK